MNNQKGFALPIVLILMVLFFIMAAGIVTMVTNEPRWAAQDENRIIARYAAEAAAKMAINEIQKNLDNGDLVALKTAKTLFTNERICDGSLATVNCTYSPDNNINPTVINIRATGKYQNVISSANVNFYLKNSPILIEPKGVVDLINTGTFSHIDHNPTSSVDKEARWKMKLDSNGTKVAIPPKIKTGKDSKGNDIYLQTMQVMFNDEKQSDTFSIAYRASARVVDAGTIQETGGGYGIYYGMIGNADQMNAYVLHYDPGAIKDNSNPKNPYESKSGSLLVKKVIYCSGVMPDSNPKQLAEFNKNQKTSSPGLREQNEYGVDSGNDSNYWALPFQTPDAGETIRVPLGSGDDKPDCKSLQTRMNEYYKSINRNETFDIYAPHTIRISIEKDSLGKLWHYVYCDDNPVPILKFTDHSKAPKKNDCTYTNDPSKYILKSFKGTRTGIRVWNHNVAINFHNDPKYKVDQTVSKSVVWVK